MKKIIVYSSNYPNEKNLFRNVFVHSRVKEYAKKYEVCVIGVDKLNSQTENYVYEGINIIIFNRRDEASTFIFESNPDILLVHFFEPWMFGRIVKSAAFPILIWIHGVEALGWYRRLFNLKNLKDFLYYIVTNTYQMLVLNRLIRYSKKNFIGFIFVSDWMRKITEFDSLIKVPKKYIIPNPINDSLFKYTEKGSETRKRILVIRSFSSKKYATDIIQDVIVKLSEREYFKELEFSIYGDGEYFSTHTTKLRMFNNVFLHQGFLEYNKIPKIHIGHGIFLCPTRQDAQGVSMCEAMSSGLIPITSLSTAIPEFVVDGESGFITKSVNEILLAFDELYYNKEKFLKMSKATHLHIINICSVSSVINAEVNLIDKYITDYQDGQLNI